MRTEAAQQEETRPRRVWLRFRLPYVLILIAALAFGTKFIQQTLHDRTEQRQLSAILAQYKAEQQKVAALHKQISHDKTIGFVRQQARAWGYVSPGQQLVMIAFKHPRYHPAARPDPPVTSHVTPVWQQWWNSFFGG